jgi:hypothetical protein
MKKRKNNRPESTTRFGLESLLKVLGTLVAIAGLAFGIYQYVNFGRREARLERNKQRSTLYEQATGIASRFAVSKTQQEAEDLDRQFWAMYNGNLGIVENESVKGAMQKFGGALKRWEKANAPPSDFTLPGDFRFQESSSSPRKSFSDLSYELSQACRKELEVP